MRKIITCAIALLTISVKLIGQENEKTKAIAAFGQGKIEEGEKLLVSYVSKNPDEAEGLIYLGSIKAQTKKYKEAIPHLEKALSLDVHPQQINDLRYFLSVCYLQEGNKQRALMLLNQIAKNGGGKSFLQQCSGPEFQTIKDDAEFKKILDIFKSNSSPCTNNDSYKKLNFFIGIWDVFTGPGYSQKVGTDTVRLQPGGCALFESFRYLSTGYTGQSFNFFDRATNKYRHHWAGVNGDIIMYEETASGENWITLFAVTTTQNNTGLMNKRMKMTYNPADGSVHQFIEESRDLGKTWTVDFDAMYKKAK
jgi:tetratricopeptide (TPR) repeat protein